MFVLSCSDEVIIQYAGFLLLKLILASESTSVNSGEMSRPAAATGRLVEFLRYHVLHTAVKFLNIQTLE